MSSSAKLRDLIIARKMLEEKSANLVVVRNGEILFAGYNEGLKDLAWLALNSPHILESASVADRVVGKAAAVIFAMNRVEAVYGFLMSIQGYQVLRENDVKAFYQKLVEYIKTPKGEICPFERLALDARGLREAYGGLIKRFREVFGEL